MAMKILQYVFMANTVVCVSILEWTLIAWIIQCLKLMREIENG